MQLCRPALVSLFLLLLSATVHAENWPQFRGPRGDGSTVSAGLPTEWAPDKNIAWQVELPGAAWSQPVVWGDRIYVTTAVTQNQQKPLVGQEGDYGRGGRGRRGPGGGERNPNGERPNPEKKEATDRGADNAPTEPVRPRGQGRGRPGGGPGRPGAGGPPPEDEYRWLVMCLDGTTGKVLWEQQAHVGKPSIPTHRTNTYASETPVTDGQRVYAYFGMTGLYCYDMDGGLAWQKNLGSFPMMLGWGTGSSPVLVDDMVVIQCDNERESFIAALDKKSGEERWRVAREERSNWSTPYVWTNAQRTEIVTAGGGKVRSYAPADGTLLWEMGGINGRCSATPVSTAEMLYLGSGGGPAGPGPLFAIRAGGSGDISLEDNATSGEFIAWMTKRAGPALASPLLHQDRIYVLDQRGGIVGCYDAKTGRQLFKQRLDNGKGFTSSPWVLGDKVFCLDESGQTFVLTAGDTLEVAAVNKLDDTFWSSAAVVGDRLLLRGVNRLYCIGAH